MENRVIIALCGKKRTGKNTVHKLMLPHISRTSKEFQFATPLKNFCIESLGLTPEQCYGTSEERESLTRYQWKTIAPHIREKYNKNSEDYLTGRDVLQVFGTDLMRDCFYNKIWAEACSRAIRRSSPSVSFITDCRFPDEVNAVVNFDEGRTIGSDFFESIIVRLYRETECDDNHDSEKALDCYDPEPKMCRISKDLDLDGYDMITHSLWRRRRGDKLFNYLIDNNYTFDDLENNVVIILKDRNIK